MLVVSDTSPLNYLILIESIGVLPILFQKIYVPNAVVAELQHEGTPPQVRAWISATPAWILVRSPLQIRPNLRLDAGEAEAISLAQELKADHVLIDEWAGRGMAQAEGLHVIGTPGVLVQASERGLLTLKDALERLLRTSFRIDQRLVDRLLEQDARRR